MGTQHNNTNNHMKQRNTTTTNTPTSRSTHPKTTHHLKPSNTVSPLHQKRPTPHYPSPINKKQRISPHISHISATPGLGGDLGRYGRDTGRYGEATFFLFHRFRGILWCWTVFDAVMALDCVLFWGSFGIVLTGSRYFLWFCMVWYGFGWLWMVSGVSLM